MNPLSLIRLITAIIIGVFTIPYAFADGDDVAVFISIGQSNADGSAMFDAKIDSTMRAWYDSDQNRGNLHIWYRSSYVCNQPQNAMGEYPRWVFDGTTTDVAPGWLNLWYRNENTNGRTAMNMVHSYGTWSTGPGFDCAQGRRGMEGQFGMDFAQAFPDTELYIIKLGVSGSHISSWVDPSDNHNWDYFVNNIFRPAMADLIAQGKRPRLAGIWWMQGCADRDRDKSYYEQSLRKLIRKCRTELGFPDAKFYIGLIVKPGENTAIPNATNQFSQEIRDAQEAVAATLEGVEIIDTRSASLQYEAPFDGYVHFDHKGVNTIGSMIAKKVIADGPDNWVRYTAPDSSINP